MRLSILYLVLALIEALEVKMSLYLVVLPLLCYLRMVDMIEKYKEEEPDGEFAELDVMERIETKFIVRIGICMKKEVVLKKICSGKLVLCPGKRVGESYNLLSREEGGGNEEVQHFEGATQRVRGAQYEEQSG